MNLIFSTSTGEYKPLSHKDSYLYDNYSQIFAFLKTLGLSKEHLQCFSKPVIIKSGPQGLSTLDGVTRIDWYSDHVGPMKPISLFDNQKRREIENSYKDFLKLIKAKINYLKQSSDNDNLSWADLLDTVFSLKNNQLVSNGVNWALIWGWDFRNESIFLDPVFPQDDPPQVSYPDPNPKKINEEIPNNQPEIPIKTETPIKPPDPVEPGIKNVSENDVTQEIPENPVTPPVIEKKYKKNYVSFLGWIKRFFRWIAYRFWGLMLLILFALIICCLCRKCCTKKSDCTNIKKIELELDSLNKKIKDRCIKR